MTEAELKEKKRDVHKEAWQIFGRIVMPILFVVLIPVAATFYYFQREQRIKDRHDTAIALWTTYDNAVNACGRGNSIRKHIGDLETVTKATNTILVAFLDTSVTFRQSQGLGAAAAQAKRAREDIATIAKAIKPIVQIDCESTIARPIVPRPGGAR